MKTTPDHAQGDCISWVKYSAPAFFGSLFIGASVSGTYGIRYAKLDP